MTFTSRRYSRFTLGLKIDKWCMAILECSWIQFHQNTEFILVLGIRILETSTLHRLTLSRIESFQLLITTVAQRRELLLFPKLFLLQTFMTPKSAILLEKDVLWVLQILILESINFKSSSQILVSMKQDIFLSWLMKVNY